MGANFVTGIQTRRAFFLNSLDCARVLARLSGRPSVMTKTTDCASARPFASSLAARARAPDVKVVDRGHVRPSMAVVMAAESVEKWLTHERPHTLAMSGGVWPAER